MSQNHQLLQPRGWGGDTWPGQGSRPLDFHFSDGLVGLHAGQRNLERPGHILHIPVKSPFIGALCLGGLSSCRRPHIRLSRDSHPDCAHEKLLIVPIRGGARLGSLYLRPVLLAPRPVFLSPAQLPAAPGLSPLPASPPQGPQGGCDIGTSEEAAGLSKVDWDLRVNVGHLLITVTLGQITRPQDPAGPGPGSTLHYSLLFTWEIYVAYLPSLCPPARAYKSCPRADRSQGLCCCSVRVSDAGG